MAAEILSLEGILERVRREGVRRTAAALRKPPVSSRLLQEMSEMTGVPEARQFVAAYSLSPGHLLELLAESTTDAEILSLLASNPRTPPHLLSKLAGHAESRVRSQVALHPQLPPREMPDLAEDESIEVRRALASNVELRLPIQAMLALDPEPSVRLALAELSSLSPQAALVLGADASAVVRVHVVASAKVEEDLLQGWASSDEEELQLALGRRKDLSIKVWRLLLRSSHASVRRMAREAQAPDEVDLLNMVTGGDPEERLWVAGQAELSRPIQRLLAQDGQVEVRAALAANPGLDADIARFFVAEADEAVCVALAGNPGVTASLVQELAALRSAAVSAALAYRDDLDSELIPLLVLHSPEFRRHWAIQGRDLSGLEEAGARGLLKDPLPLVRALAVQGHAWRRAELYDIARDPVSIVRLAAVRHPNAPDELLEDRCADTDASVARTASETLEARRQAAKLARPNQRQTVSSTSHAPEQPRPVAANQPAPAHAEQTASDPGLLNKLKRLFFR